MSVRIEVYRGVTRIALATANGPRIRVGSDEGSDVRVEGGAPRIAEIALEDGDWWVRPEGGSMALLADDGVVRIGGVRLVIEPSASATDAPAGPIGLPAIDDEDSEMDPVDLLDRPPATASANVELEVTQIWGDAILGDRRFAKGRSVSIGEDADFWDSANGPLVRWEGRWVVPVAEGWTGFVSDGVSRTPLQAGLQELVPGKAVLVDTGARAYHLRLADRPGRAAWRVAVDWVLVSLSTMGLLCGIAFAAALFVTPPPQPPPPPTPGDGAGQGAGAGDAGRMASYLAPASGHRGVPSHDPTAADDGASAPDLAASGAEAQELAAVASGTADALPAIDAQGEAGSDAETVRGAGVLGALTTSANSDVLGNGVLSDDVTSGLGRLIVSAEGFDQLGAGALGMRGGGIGGGGTAEGLGGLGTRGVGYGMGGTGAGFGTLGAKLDGVICTLEADPIVIGSMDRALIDEVIQRHMNQIRYCYQRELVGTPDLGGKIAMKFTIAKDGTVSSANVKESTMGNADVESCLVGRFQRMQFPQPKGGGIVIVSYPLTFSAR